MMVTSLIRCYNLIWISMKNWFFSSCACYSFFLFDFRWIWVMPWLCFGICSFCSWFIFNLGSRVRFLGRVNSFAAGVRPSHCSRVSSPARSFCQERATRSDLLDIVAQLDLLAWQTLALVSLSRSWFPSGSSSTSAAWLRFGLRARGTSCRRLVVPFVAFSRRGLF
jgi:hypothetical protein